MIVISDDCTININDACYIIIDDSRVMLRIVVSLSDDSRCALYDHNMFIVQATGLFNSLVPRRET
jgi:hypothetical protein